MEKANHRNWAWVVVAAAVWVGMNVSGANLSISASAPTTDILDCKESGGTLSKIFDYNARPDHNSARGQLFHLGDGEGAGYAINAITFKKKETQTFNGASLTLHIFKGDADDWSSGTGRATEMADRYPANVKKLHTETFALTDGQTANGNFLTFNLSSPLEVNENTTLGFFITFEQGSSVDPFFQLDEFSRGATGTGGERLQITGTSHDFATSRDMIYYIQGTVVHGTDTMGMVVASHDGAPFIPREPSM